MSADIERSLRDALAVEPSEAADRCVLDAIHSMDMQRGRHRVIWGWWAAAACLAIVLAGGILRYGGEPERISATPNEVGEVMLEIIGMASIDEFYAHSAANEPIVALE